MKDYQQAWYLNLLFASWVSERPGYFPDDGQLWHLANARTRRLFEKECELPKLHRNPLGAYRLPNILRIDSSFESRFLRYTPVVALSLVSHGSLEMDSAPFADGGG